MPQNPTNGTISVGSQIVANGLNSSLNISAAKVIKVGAGRVVRISVLGVVGTGGAMTLNDCATTAAAATTNQIYTSVGTIAVGSIITLDFPFATGLVVSAVPTGGTPLFAISYT